MNRRESGKTEGRRKRRGVGRGRDKAEHGLVIV